MSNNYNLQVGLIGGGYWGKNLIREFYATGCLKYVCDTNQQALDKYQELYPNLVVTTNYQDLLDDPEVSAIVIALPEPLHYQFAKQALLADKDVFVEKPMTLQIATAEELVYIAKQRNLIIHVGHLLHYHPAVIKMKNLIKQQVIGKVKHIVSHRLNMGIFRTNNNVLWSFAPHDISIILSLMGDQLPSSVGCNGQKVLINDNYDTTSTFLKFDHNGESSAEIKVSWLHPNKEQKMVVIGESGILVFEDTSPDQKLKYYSDYLQWNVNSNPAIPMAKKNPPQIVDIDTTISPLQNEVNHFLECCQTRQQPISNGEEGLRVLKVLAASQRSLQTDSNTITNLHYPDVMIHSSATIDNGAIVGKDTKVWHYSHISSNAMVGDNCNIGQNVFIAPKAKIGNHCKIQNNVSVYAGVECQDHVFLGPSCVLTNDKNPRCLHPKNGNYIKTLLKTGCSIGANATIICGVTVGQHALIGAGTVVTKDVPDYAVMVGNPAKQIGTIDEEGNITKFGDH